jgi:hypothetical protein
MARARSSGRIAARRATRITSVETIVWDAPPHAPYDRRRARARAGSRGASAGP